MFALVSYDIRDDRRRTRLATLLENFGTRVQYSVFECRLSVAQLGRLRTRMAPLLDLREDSVRFYYLPRDAVTAIEIFGPGEVTRDRAYYT